MTRRGTPRFDLGHSLHDQRLRANFPLDLILALQWLINGCWPSSTPQRPDPADCAPWRDCQRLPSIPSKVPVTPRLRPRLIPPLPICRVTRLSLECFTGKGKLSSPEVSAPGRGDAHHRWQATRRWDERRRCRSLLSPPVLIAPSGKARAVTPLPSPAPAQCKNGTDQFHSSLFPRDSGEPVRSSTRGEELRPDQHRIHRESPGALRAALPNSTLVTPASSTTLLPPPMGKRRSNTAVGSSSARDVLLALGYRTTPRDPG
jgi:hypothetical protein